MNQDRMIGVRVPDELLKGIRELAERDKRSMSDWIRIQLERAIDRRLKTRKRAA